jgi:hypothetical protein
MQRQDGIAGTAEDRDLIEVAVGTGLRWGELIVRQIVHFIVRSRIRVVARGTSGVKIESWRRHLLCFSAHGGNPGNVAGTRHFLFRAR